MIIIPAVDIKDGKCVQLVQGKPGTEQVVIDDPVEVALKWEKMGAKRLHIVDLDGALESGVNLEIIKEIVEKTTEGLKEIYKDLFPERDIKEPRVLLIQRGF